MQYLHEVYTGADFFGMRHLRANVLPSGLIDVKEIAQTQAIVAPAPQRPYPFGLYLRLDPNPPKQQVQLNKIIECNENDMVDRGVKGWEETLSHLGGRAIKVMLTHIEVRTPIPENVTAGGLILLPEPDARAEFKSYVSTSHEMDSIETMVSRVNAGLHPASEMTGQYA